MPDFWPEPTLRLTEAFEKPSFFSMNLLWNLHLTSHTHTEEWKEYDSVILFFVNWTLRQDVLRCFVKKSLFSSFIPAPTPTPSEAHTHPHGTTRSLRSCAFTHLLEVVYHYLFPSVTSHCCYYRTVIIIFVPVTHLDRKALRTLITLWPDMELYF